VVLVGRRKERQGYLFSSFFQCEDDVGVSPRKLFGGCIVVVCTLVEVFGFLLRTMVQDKLKARRSTAAFLGLHVAIGV
jgi:hypothetical protein